MQEHIMKALKKTIVLAGIVSAGQFLLNCPVLAERACVMTSAGQKVCGTLMPGDSTGDSKSQASVAIVGKWQSNYGPVIFKPDLTGYWYQGGSVGQIKDWTYDPKTTKLVFHYYQPWNNLSGTAKMTLLEDAKRLDGTWSQQTESGAPAGAGGWTMTRDSSQ